MGRRKSRERGETVEVQEKGPRELANPIEYRDLSPRTWKGGGGRFLSLNSQISPLLRIEPGVLIIAIDDERPRPTDHSLSLHHYDGMKEQ